MGIFKTIRSAGAIGLIALAPCAALAQAWPAGPVRLFVGSPPGAPSDITARLFADQLGKLVKQPVIVDNRPGAGNNLAAIAAAKAEPDGATLVLSPDTVLTVNPHIYKNRDFDPKADLVNVSIIGSFSQMLVCHPSVGVKTVSELVAKSKTERILYGSGGPGCPGTWRPKCSWMRRTHAWSTSPTAGPRPLRRRCWPAKCNAASSPRPPCCRMCGPASSRHWPSPRPRHRRWRPKFPRWPRP